MIYILKKLKNSGREKKMAMTSSEAKQFLYEISNKNFTYSIYAVLGADHKNEFTDLLEFFNPEYFIRKSYDILDIYVANEKIPKLKRQRHDGASIDALLNFKTKIKKAFPDSIVSLTFENAGFLLLVILQDWQVKINCTYDLKILNSYVYLKDGQFTDIIGGDAITKFVNKLFRNQRYYYSRKDKK